VSDEYPNTNWIKAETTPVPVNTPSGQYVGDLTIGTAELQRPDASPTEVSTPGASEVNQCNVMLAAPRRDYPLAALLATKALVSLMDRRALHEAMSWEWLQLVKAGRPTRFRHLIEQTA